MTLQFTGRENDETGLMYYRARYYAPQWGRFVSEDPSGFGGGVNQYAYVANNPLSFTDPSGLVRIEVWFREVDHTGGWHADIIVFDNVGNDEPVVYYGDREAGVPSLLPARLVGKRSPLSKLNHNWRHFEEVLVNDEPAGVYRARMQDVIDDINNSPTRMRYWPVPEWSLLPAVNSNTAANALLEFGAGLRGVLSKKEIRDKHGIWVPGFDLRLFDIFPRPTGGGVGPGVPLMWMIAPPLTLPAQ